MVDQPVVLGPDETAQAAQQETEEERQRAIPEVGKVVQSQVEEASVRRHVGWPGPHCDVGPAGGAVLHPAGHHRAESGGVVGSLLPGNHLTEPGPEDDQ